MTRRTGILIVVLFAALVLVHAPTISAETGPAVVDLSAAVGSASVTAPQPLDPDGPIGLNSTIFNVRVASGNDDAEEVGPGGTFLGGPGNIYTVSTDLEIVNDSEAPPSGNQIIGLRFNGVSIPHYASITNAYLVFKAVSPDSPNTNNGATNVTLFGQAADNPPGFIGTSNNPTFDISTRPRTAASTNWAPGAWSNGVSYNSPNISGIVQEIVSRAGWASGNSMVFIITGTGSRSAASYNGVPADAPLLVVEYVTGVTLTPDNVQQADAGTTETYAHALAYSGGVAQAFNLSAVSGHGWTTRIYQDVNGNGVKDPGDTQITQTPVLTAPATFHLLVELDIPGSTASGTFDDMIVTATGQTNPVTASATDTTAVGIPPFTEPVIDGLIDPAYIYNPYSNVQDYCDANGDVLARLMTTYDVNDPTYDNVYIVLEMDLALVDNSYGATVHQSWIDAGKSHTLGNLDGSDRAQFNLFDGNGTLVYDPVVDYVEPNQPGFPSGWASAGITGGEGSANGLNPAYFEGATSIEYDLNRFCTSPASCTVQGVNLYSDSPPVDLYYNPTNSFFNDWEYSYIYEIAIDPVAFGVAGFGSVSIPFTHVSPNKIGSNEIPVTPCTGSIGDRVWHDLNSNALQDASEPGLNGVQLVLYRDNGDNIFNANTDYPHGSMNTSGNGDYDFTGLGPDVYFVDVVNSTVPPQFIITTNNDPTSPIVLDTGEDYNDADFGYVTVAEVDVSKIQTTPGPVLVGDELSYTIRITNTGQTVIDILPLQDLYDTTVLDFLGAVPPTVNNIDDGVLNWTDLTTTFGNVLPGQSVDVIVNFRATAPTTGGALLAGGGVQTEPVVDGALDNGYVFDRRYTLSDTDVPGNLYSYAGASMCYYAFVVDRGFNDNVYSNPDNRAYMLMDGWDRTHKYGDLDGSDHIEITIPPLGAIKLDYIEYSNGQYLSGYTGQDGSSNTPTPPGSQAATSLDWNADNSGWSMSNFQIISPPYDYNHTSGFFWQWQMIYEWAFPKTSLGGVCRTNQAGNTLDIAAHNSPSKYDSNLGSIGDRVWIDLDRDGVQDANEVGLPGVQLNLLQNNVVVRTAETEPGPSGYYIFNNLAAGTYTVDVVESSLPPLYQITYDEDSGTVNPNGLTVVVLPSGGTHLTADFGYALIGTGSIGDRVFYDLNGDGLPDNDGDPGLNGVTVRLFKDTVLYETKETTGNGDYLFDSLPPGNYQVVVDETTLPPGLTTTTSNNPLSHVLLENEDFLNADFGYRAQSPGETCDMAIVSGAKDINGGSAPLDGDHVCTEILEPAVIGNYVWFDENEDGYQDAGEPGLANVIVELRDAAMNLLATQTTDANGGYLFTNLAPDTYKVQVNAASLPAGMYQTINPVNPGGDFGNQSQPYMVTVAGGEENLTADFGYTLGNPNDNDEKGAIGDRVWIDTDGDGAQDLGEAGLGGITVKIYFDSNGDGVVQPGVDALYTSAIDQNGATGSGTTTTDPDGFYIFSNLPAGAYKIVVTPPAGYGQTGDPDDFGVPAVSPDNQTTNPVVLGPGDVFLNADFGYQPPAAANNTIGDRVWLDSDADGVQDATEHGINGVTVALLNASGQVIATDVTSGDGIYLFTGLPDGTYTVKVTDTDNVLDGLIQSGDPDAVFDGMSTVVNLGVGNPNPVVNLTQDFGYTPLGHQNGEGLIGDTIFLNTDGDNVQDLGEPGIEGVVVNLLDANLSVIATTTTNENGNYYFGGLNPLATYTVQVAASNFNPGGVLEGLANSADPDDSDANPSDQDNKSLVNLGAPGNDGNADEDGLDNGINLGQDFGYTPPAGQASRIGNLIWLDSNANGVYDAGLGESPIGGVTVDLYRDLNANGLIDPGEPLVSTTTSNATIVPGAYGTNGNYIFPGLPADSYVVDVTDEANILTGYWHSIGASAGSDNNSRVDPYALTVAAGADNLKADFGYYVEPASIGDFVWNDINLDGIQDGGEPGIAGVEVTLIITYPNSDVTILTTLTDLTGHYKFDGLLTDEDYDGVGTPGVDEPLFVVKSEIPDGLTTTLINQGANDAIDSDDPVNGEQAEPKQGQADNTNDFGFVNQVLAAIGNYVWIDENADGYQDAGEPGLPNVLVQLYDDQAMLLDVAQTDLDGGYLFSDLAPGAYVVQVNAASLPSGLVQTTNPVNPGADFGNQSQPYFVTVGPGEENLTADFGYVWGNPNGNTGKGAIGDRIWIDADGDGVQDAGEPGLGGIQVTIYYDSNNDGRVQPGIDLPFPGAIDQNGNVDSSTLTEPDGSYIFYNLPAGQYVIVVTTPPAGYTQTGDPDNFGEPAVAPDNRTTTPVVLGPGDVFLNADFGYRPNSVPSNTIGDTIYLDANGNGTQDFGEPGIPGVTVALLDSAGNIIATDVTDENGLYLFAGLPNGTYTVKVTDTNNVLGELMQTGDPDGTLDEMSTVTVSGGVSNLDQDFGYAPPGHNAGEGLIGDTIFIDSNNNGLPDIGEGVEGVTVRLYDAAGVTLLGATVTNEDGLYYFGNLNPTGTYQVVVDTTTLPPGLFNSVDPDGGFDSRSVVNLSTTPDGIDLDQDFGYILPSHQPTDGVIGDTIFLDINHNNLPDAGEGLAGVTVQLFDASNNLIAVTVTDENGLYYFPGLPAGSYTVKVDTATLPPGVTNTVDPDGGNNSQSAVTLAAGQVRLDQDFGYVPANPGSGTGSIGDTIYLDANGNGAPNAGEGLPGVVVYLYNSAGNLVGATITNANGIYTFNNLPAGTYSLVVNTDTVPGGLVNTVDPDGGNDSQSTVTIGNGNPLVNLDQDFGYAPPGHNAGEGLIGDTIFLDANGNGTPDAGEGLPGVTVRLYDGLGNPVAVTTTDDNGLYYFGGLPAGNYKVVVDTTTVPGGLVNTIDPDGGNDSQSTLTIGNGNPLVNLNQDFGYAPPNHNAGEGLIGDTIFLDANGNHLPDAGEGIGGVTVRLFNSSNILVGTTTTDDNGLYYFGNLTPGTYKVVVDTTTLPAGLTNTVDPDGVKDSQSLVSIGGINPLVNLNQDFGYVPTNFAGGVAGAVGNQVWLDVNANGVYEPANGEYGIAGVTVDLYWDLNGDGRVNAGEPRLGTETTDGNGRYLFDNLPVDDGGGNARYVVDVTDVGGQLSGYWHSLGAAGVDNNSQIDPYGVTLTPAAPINLTADFGYYVDPASIGDYVWFDEDKNGIQNTSPFEAPLPGAILTLTITYPNGNVTKLVAQTNIQGKYVFGNLLLDEDYDGVGTPGVDEPAFIVASKKPQIDYVATPQDQGGNDNLDSDDPTGTQALPVQGQSDLKYDFGWIPGVVTAVSLSNVSTLGGAAYGGLAAAGGLLLVSTLVVVRRRRSAEIQTPR